MTLSLCFAGCGNYARTVLGEIQHPEGIELFFASRSLDKARSFGDEFGGAGYFGSYEEAAQDPRVDAMYFLTPHDAHLDNVLLAARHGKHVLIEKPIARTIPEAREMIRAAREAGVRLMVAENYRFLPAVDRCKELMAQGAIGDLRLIQLQNEGFQAPTGWRVSAAARGGGGFIDGGIHDVDMLVHLGGLPSKVYAVMPTPVQEIEGEDGLLMTCHLPGGAIAGVNYSSATSATEQGHWVSVTGTQGRISFKPFGSEVVVDTLGGKRVIELEKGGKGTREMVLEFRDSVLDGREPVMSGEEGLRDLAVVLAAYASAAQGQAVAVSVA